MKLSSLLREAGRNIMSGTTRFTLFSQVLALLVGGLVLADALATARLVASAEAFRASGAATEILVAEGQVDGAACEALAGLPGVTASGALRSSERRIAIATIPDAPIPTYEISPGFAAVVSDPNPGEGVLIPDDLARTAGVGGGGSVATDSGPIQIASVYRYPSDGRRAGFGYAILSPTNSNRPFDECWATAWPQIPNLRSFLHASMLPSKGTSTEKPTVVQLNSALGASFDGSVAFAGRLTHYATPLSATIALCQGFVSVRIRRLQQTSALHAGVSRGDLLALNLLEGGAWSAPAAMIGAALASAATWMIGRDDQLAVFETLVAIPLAGMAGALIGVAVGSATMSEKQLFRYFKDR
ncbi:hypothetical protein KNO15_06930 [Leifsonia shinshuensis]|uniref:hypothetical protein n=1 Tax=Leifsonia shinshuensis TaxID=150026 RepID=UPI001F505B51|nr:hypothetical protein [Leifsonia shinshuensis]MCI0156426.1 hypothetical protein [Leifsonia shinshuensis]